MIPCDHRVHLGWRTTNPNHDQQWLCASKSSHGLVAFRRDSYRMSLLHAKLVTAYAERPVIDVACSQMFMQICTVASVTAGAAKRQTACAMSTNLEYDCDGGNQGCQTSLSAAQRRLRMPQNYPSPSGESILRSLSDAFQARRRRPVHIVVDMPVQGAAFAA